MYSLIECGWTNQKEIYKSEDLLHVITKGNELAKNLSWGCGKCITLQSDGTSLGEFKPTTGRLQISNFKWARQSQTILDKLSKDEFLTNISNIPEEIQDYWNTSVGKSRSEYINQNRKEWEKNRCQK